MNRPAINHALLAGVDVNSGDVVRDDKFYAYLLNNKVAHYYATQLSKQKTQRDIELAQSFDVYEEKFVKTLSLVDRICKKQGIEYLLYKTYRFVPEVVDGDIDLIVRKSDFQKFLDAFEDIGFDCIEDEPGKGKCEKDGYNVVEPHVNVSWRGGGYLKEDFLWSNTIDVKVGGLDVKNVSLEVEVVAIAAKILFEPAYLDIYSLKLLQYCYEQNVDRNHMLEATMRPDMLEEVLRYCESFLNRDIIRTKMPAFLPPGMFFRLWTRNCIQSKDYKIYLLHSLFYVYWRVRYMTVSKLPFTHHVT